MLNVVRSRRGEMRLRIAHGWDIFTFSRGPFQHEQQEPGERWPPPPGFLLAVVCARVAPVSSRPAFQHFLKRRARYDQALADANRGYLPSPHAFVGSISADSEEFSSLGNGQNKPVLYLLGHREPPVTNGPKGLPVI